MLLSTHLLCISHTSVRVLLIPQQTRESTQERSKLDWDNGAAVAAVVHHMIDTDITGARLPCFDHR
jgi:hypothetical protein